MFEVIVSNSSYDFLHRVGGFARSTRTNAIHFESHCNIAIRKGTEIDNHRMAGEKRDEPRKDPHKPHESVELPCRGETTVEISDKAPPPSHEKIHRRRPMPPVPDKKARRKGD